MRQERIKTAISWVLVAACMGVIFWLSSRTATESAEQSSTILDWIRSILGYNAFSDFIIRKTAHFLEFTGLCLLFNIALWQTKKKAMYLPAICFTSLYAITDEVHQIFVDGRSCELRDWGIDTIGAILGALAFFIISLILKAINKKSIDTAIK